MKPDRNFRWDRSNQGDLVLRLYNIPEAVIRMQWGKPRVYLNPGNGAIWFPLMGPAFPDMPAAIAAIRDWFGNQRIPEPPEALTSDTPGKSQVHPRPSRR